MILYSSILRVFFSVKFFVIYFQTLYIHRPRVFSITERTSVFYFYILFKKIIFIYTYM